MPNSYESENQNIRPSEDDGAPRPATEPPGAKPSSQTDKIDAGSGENPPGDADPSRQPS
jgi:hypothetical protein